MQLIFYYFSSHERCVLEKLVLIGRYSMEGTAWYEISEDAKDLIKRMLVVNPDHRITLEGILNHPWIEKVRYKRSVWIVFHSKKVQDI